MSTKTYYFCGDKLIRSGDFAITAQSKKASHSNEVKGTGKQSAQCLCTSGSKVFL